MSDLFPTEMRTLSRDQEPEMDLGLQGPPPRRRWHACLGGLEWGQRGASGEMDVRIGLSSIVGQLAAVFKTLVLSL